VEAASAQNCLPVLALDSIQHAFEIMVLFILSATPFYCGVYGMMWCLTMPAFLQKSLNSFEQNSIPLSVRQIFTFLSVCFSTITFQALKASNASYLCFRKLGNTLLE
jgi:hypothetical protein